MKSDGSIFTLENEELLITVESHGAQLSRIYDKKADREILWSADPAVWNRHSPILFPFIGKSVDGKYRYEGRNTIFLPTDLHEIWILNLYSVIWTSVHMY